MSARKSFWVRLRPVEVGAAAAETEAEAEAEGAVGAARTAAPWASRTRVAEAKNIVYVGDGDDYWMETWVRLVRYAKTETKENKEIEDTRKVRKLKNGCYLLAGLMLIPKGFNTWE